jgi:transposase-like protein
MRKHCEYTPEFRAAAVEMVRTSGESIRQVALNLGISNQIPGDWLRHFQAADSRPSTPPSDRSCWSCASGCTPSRPSGTS